LVQYWGDFGFGGFVERFMPLDNGLAVDFDDEY
jgi:hypothetical protein